MNRFKNRIIGLFEYFRNKNKPDLDIDRLWARFASESLCGVRQNSFWKLREAGLLAVLLQQSPALSAFRRPLSIGPLRYHD